MSNPYSLSKLARLFSVGNGDQIVGVDSSGNPLIHSGLWAKPQRPKYINTNTAVGGGSFTFDPNTHGQVALITLTGSGVVTLGAPTNIVEGTPYTFMIKAGDTSARSFAYNAAFKFGGQVSPLSNGATVSGSFDMINWIGGAANTMIYNGHKGDVR